MSIHCLAIGADNTNRQELHRAFQVLDDEFKLSFAKNVLDAVFKLDFTLFSLVICGSSHADPSISISNLIRFLEENRFYPPILTLDSDKVSRQRSIQENKLLAGTIQKPIIPADLAGKILNALKARFYQGEMTEIGFISALQLIELDKLTCTLAIFHPDYRNEGLVFFRDGCPIDSQFGKLQGELAIKKIFSLGGDVDIKMFSTCPLVKDRLKTNCSKLILNNEGFRPGRNVSVTQSVVNQSPKNAVGKRNSTGLAGLFMKVKKNK